MHTLKDRLVAAQQKTGHSLCLGIDPRLDDPDSPAFLRHEVAENGRIAALSQLCSTTLSAANSRVAAIKPQSAFFEAEGWQGIQVLQNLVEEAQKQGMFVLLDGKRGDIASTMAAYGRAMFDLLNADAVTVSPYLGCDVIKALVPWIKRGHGIYVVWITSNRTGHEIQENVASALLERISSLVERESIQDGVGLVLGANKVEGIDAPLWQRCQRYPLLLPGIGPQGGECGARLSAHMHAAHLGEAAPPLIPMSRALTGIGDPLQQNALNKLTGWDEYQSYMEQRIDAAIAEMPPN